ncbi:MAG TPA: hypothetical protein VGK13_07100 [Methanocellaceae archaeon]|jgi:hypothetical protein
MEGRWVRLVKLFWLPALLLIMIALEPYLGVWKSRYWIEYLVLQVILLVVYAYILFMDSRKTRARALSVKGRRKNKK